MSPRRILAILLKDLRDAARDGRIVVLLALPIGMAVFYNATTPDEGELPDTEIAVVESGGAVARELRSATGKSVELKLRRARSALAARELVADGDIELAVVVRSAPRAERARALVFVAQDASPIAQAVVALVPDALTRAAGREPPAQTIVRAVAPADQKPYEVIEQRSLSVLIVIVLLVAFVAMMIVPIQTAEELEAGTFGALRLAATGGEILAAKAFAGFLYSLAGVAVTILLTGLSVHDPPLFVGAALALTVSLVGFGLLMGLLIPNANAINSYGAFMLFPFIGLAAAVFVVEPGTFATILDLLPFSQAAKLLADGLSADSPFHAGLSSWGVIGAWALLGYLILGRISTRREV